MIFGAEAPPTSKDNITATESVSGVGARQGTKEGANNEHGDNDALDSAVVALGGACGMDSVDLREGLDPVLLGQKTTNSCLVVAEQDEGRSHDQGSLQSGQGFTRNTKVVVVGDHLHVVRGLLDLHKTCGLGRWVKTSLVGTASLHHVWEVALNTISLGPLIAHSDLCAALGKRAFGGTPR